MYCNKFIISYNVYTMSALIVWVGGYYAMHALGEWIMFRLQCCGSARPKLLGFKPKTAVRKATVPMSYTALINKLKLNYYFTNVTEYLNTHTV